MEVLKLQDVTAGDINKMKVDELKELADSESVSTEGVKKDIAERLINKKLGRSERYVGTETRCSFCGETVKVTGTHKQKLDDGRTLVTRQIRCNGKHRHTYPLKGVI